MSDDDRVRAIRDAAARRVLSVPEPRHQNFALYPARDRAVHRNDTVTITGAEYLATRRRLLRAEQAVEFIARVLGSSAPKCEGCAVEIGEALKIIAEAQRE